MGAHLTDAIIFYQDCSVLSWFSHEAGLHMLLPILQYTRYTGLVYSSNLNLY